MELSCVLLVGALVLLLTGNEKDPFILLATTAFSIIIFFATTAFSIFFSFFPSVPWSLWWTKSVILPLFQVPL